jgi:hypothetical protein
MRWPDLVDHQERVAGESNELLLQLAHLVGLGEPGDPVGRRWRNGPGARLGRPGSPGRCPVGLAGAGSAALISRRIAIDLGHLHGVTLTGSAGSVVQVTPLSTVQAGILRDCQALHRPPSRPYTPPDLNERPAVAPAGVNTRPLTARACICAGHSASPGLHPLFARRLRDDGEVSNEAAKAFLRDYMIEFRDHVERVLTVLPRP